MSFRQMELALAAPVSNAQFRILMLLASYAHDDGTSARPGIGRLVMRSGMSERSVQEALHGLREAGLIEPLAHEHGGRGRATEYRLLLQTPQDSAPIEPRFSAPFYTGKGATKRKPPAKRVQIAAAKGAENRTERVRETAPNGAANRTPICQEPVIESVKEPVIPPGPPKGGGFAALSQDARIAVDDWRQKQGKTRPPNLNPVLIQEIETAVLDLGLERLAESATWAASRQVTEPIKWIRAARTKRQADEQGVSVAAYQPRHVNGHAKPNGSPLSRTQATAEVLQASAAKATGNTLTDARILADPEWAMRMGVRAATIDEIRAQHAAKGAPP